MSKPTAVVVGLCAHGLALTRTLSKAGVSVVAIEANRSLPGVRTLSAEPLFVDDINGPSLVDSLARLAPRLSGTAVPVLFLTNDTMIETVGRHYETLGDLYHISWGRCCQQLLPLLRKQQVHDRCVEAGMLHPKSAFIRGGADMRSQVHDLNFPLILKPDKPVSAYKTLIIESEHELHIHQDLIERSVPAIAQEFIPGGDPRIYFAALYLDQGKVVARYEGRKLRSRPMGHTTVAIGEKNDETHALACKFFNGLHLSGPVSLELKADPEGRFWVIEPTVGRSDFWVGLCIADGVSLPLIEYYHQIGARYSGRPQQERTVWINGERDPLALLWLLTRYPQHVFGRRPVGVYFSLGDHRPAFKWMANYIESLPRRVVRRLAKSARPLK